MSEPSAAAGASAERYALRVKEHIDQAWSEWFEGMKMTHTGAGETVLTGPVADQAALHGLLARVRDLNLTLISVNRLEPEAPLGPGGPHEELHETAEDPAQAADQ
jgi:hypothetical protein